MLVQGYLPRLPNSKTNQTNDPSSLETTSHHPLIAPTRQLHPHPLIAHNGVADTRLVEQALLVLALGIGHVVLVYPALAITRVLELFFADDVVEDLLLRVHLGVVERLGEWLFARQPRGERGYACAYVQHGDGCCVDVWKGGLLCGCFCFPICVCVRWDVEDVEEADKCAGFYQGAGGKNRLLESIVWLGWEKKNIKKIGCRITHPFRVVEGSDCGGRVDLEW